MSGDNISTGTPVWADLWTSDVEGSRKFYGEIFGWEPTDPIPEFGGYFNFLLHGGFIAGGMGDMGDMKADNRWKCYFATDDATKSAAIAEREGATIVAPPMPVADLGVQVVLVDPTGAPFGMWQPGTHRGFAARKVPGAPNWFELHTSDHARATEFYRAVFGYELAPVGETDEFRYTIFRNAEGEDCGGIMDARNFLPDGAGSRWGIYWEVEDPVATLARVGELGGSVVMDVHDTPYGRLAVAADPSGAEFRLRAENN